jgi:RNA polymerase sigma-70 factor (ECF subfamily)
LPEQYRAALLLSDFEELANAEIAEILGLSLDTVKIRLHRARTRLRAALECQCTFVAESSPEGASASSRNLTGGTSI